jgi:hypothetical protein
MRCTCINWDVTYSKFAIDYTDSGSQCGIVMWHPWTFWPKPWHHRQVIELNHPATVEQQFLFFSFVTVYIYGKGEGKQFMGRPAWQKLGRNYRKSARVVEILHNSSVQFVIWLCLAQYDTGLIALECRLRPMTSVWCSMEKSELMGVGMDSWIEGQLFFNTWWLTGATDASLTEDNEGCLFEWVNISLVAVDIAERVSDIYSERSQRLNESKKSCSSARSTCQE